MEKTINGYVETKTKIKDCLYYKTSLTKVDENEKAKIYLALGKWISPRKTKTQNKKITITISDESV